MSRNATSSSQLCDPYVEAKELPTIPLGVRPLAGTRCRRSRTNGGATRECREVTLNSLEQSAPQHDQRLAKTVFTDPLWDQVRTKTVGFHPRNSLQGSSSAGRSHPPTTRYFLPWRRGERVGMGREERGNLMTIFVSLCPGCHQVMLMFCSWTRVFNGMRGKRSHLL